MLLAVWSEQYNVNVKKMDQQHKEILNMMNYLDKAIQEGKEDKLIRIAVDELNNCWIVNIQPVCFFRLMNPAFTFHSIRDFPHDSQVPQGRRS